MRRRIVVCLGLLAALAAVSGVALASGGARPASALVAIRAAPAAAAAPAHPLRPGLVTPRQILREKALHFLATSPLLGRGPQPSRRGAIAVTPHALQAPRSGVCPVAAPGCSLVPCDEFAVAGNPSLAAAVAAPTSLTAAPTVVAPGGRALRNGHGRCTGRPGTPPRILRVALTPVF